MKSEASTQPDYRHFVGQVEYRETETTIFSCLAVFLRLWGVKVGAIRNVESRELGAVLREGQIA